MIELRPLDIGHSTSRRMRMDAHASTQSTNSPDLTQGRWITGRGPTAQAASAGPSCSPSLKQPIDYGKSEAQIALDLTAQPADETPEVYNPVTTRQRMAGQGLRELVTDVHLPTVAAKVESDVALVEF